VRLPHVAQAKRARRRSHAQRQAARPSARLQAKRGQKAQVDFAPAVGGIGLKIENGATAREGRGGEGGRRSHSAALDAVPWRVAWARVVTAARCVANARERPQALVVRSEDTPLLAALRVAAAHVVGCRCLVHAVCGRSDRGGQAEYPSV
jgi:hypothetical protein